MSDLIRREDAIAEVSKEFKNSIIGTHCAVSAIYRAPSVERTGRWTHVYDEDEKLFFRNKWVCSVCGESNTYGMSDFCPWCGAMMENSTRRMKEAKK